MPAAPHIRKLTDIAKAATRLADDLETAKSPVKGNLMQALAGNHRPQPELLAALVSSLRYLSKVRVPRTRGRGRPRSEHVDYAVLSLARFWESVSGNRFTQSFTTAPGPGDEFVSDSPCFV